MHSRQHAAMDAAEISKPAYEQAIDVALVAWSKWSTRAGAGARRDYIRQHLTADMLWALIENWSRRGGDAAIRFLLDDAARRIEDDRLAARCRDSAGKPVRLWPGDVPQERADATRERNEAEAKKEALRELKVKAEAAADLLGDVDHTEPTVALAVEIRRGAQAAGAAAEQAEKMRLYSFLIDGRPLAECTAREALAWCERQERDIEFVRALCHGVPLDDTLGRWYAAAPVEVEAVWKRVNSAEFTARRNAYRQRFVEAWEDAKRLAAEIGPDGLHALKNEALKWTQTRDAVAFRANTRDHIESFPDPFGLKDGSIASPAPN